MDRNWASDPWTFSFTLYQLSYKGSTEVCTNPWKFMSPKRKTSSYTHTAAMFLDNLASLGRGNS